MLLGATHRRLVSALAGLALGALGMLAPSTARADSLSADEMLQLARGETVARSQTIERGDHRYVGGVTYTTLDATPEELDAILDDVAVWQKLLPRTKSATLVGKVGERGSDSLVELRQGSSVFETSYTIRLHKDAASRTVRFWMDPSRPHGIDDAWGFFRVAQLEPGRVMLTFGVLLDMGDGIGRALFEERVRVATLAVPQRLRDFLAIRHARQPNRVTMR